MWKGTTSGQALRYSARMNYDERRIIRKGGDVDAGFRVPSPMTQEVNRTKEVYVLNPSSSRIDSYFLNPEEKIVETLKRLGKVRVSYPDPSAEAEKYFGLTGDVFLAALKNLRSRRLVWYLTNYRASPKFTVVELTRNFAMYLSKTADGGLTN